MNHHLHMSGLDESLFWNVNSSTELAEPKGEANPSWMMMMMINQWNQNQLATPLCTQASTSNGVNTHMLYQNELAALCTQATTNNSPSPQPAAGTSRAPKLPITGTAGEPVTKKRLRDKAYRKRVKEGRKEMESNLRELSEENKDLQRNNESLKMEKDLAVEKLQRTNYEKNQLETQFFGLKHQSDSLEICVRAFAQKMFAFDNVHEHYKQLEDELAGLSAKICWEDWMSKKLQLMDRIELLKYQNRILNVQVEALCQKKYKQ